MRNLCAARTEFSSLPGPRIISTRGTGPAAEKGWAIYGISVVFSTRNRGGFFIGVVGSSSVGSTNLHSLSSSNDECFRARNTRIDELATDFPPPISAILSQFPHLHLRRQDWQFPRSPFNVLRLSGPRHSPIYSTLPRTTVIRPAVRCQATSRNEIKLEGVNGGPIKCIHLAHRVPHASARKAFSGLDWRKAE